MKQSEHEATGKEWHFPVPFVPRDADLESEIGNAGDFTRLARIYEVILSTTDDFAYVFDRQGRFLYANARLLTVWAKSLDQVVGKTCHDLGYPTWHADMHMREVQQIVRTKTALRGEVPFTGESGISGIYDYIFQPVLDAEGNVEVIVGTTRDVTDRKRNEEMLKTTQIELHKRATELESALKEKGEAAAKFRALFDQSSVFAGIAATNGVLLEANSLSTIGCGYRVQDVVGQPFWECGWWNRSAEVQEKVRKGMRSAAAGVPFIETMPYFLADGTERVVDLVLHPIRDAKGEVIYINPTGVDVTERHRAHANADFLAQLTQKLSLVSDALEINRIATREIGEFLKADRCYCFQVMADYDHVRVLPDYYRDGESSLMGEHLLSEFGPPELRQALRDGPLAVEDVRMHPLTRDFVASYVPIHLISYAFVPFVHEGKWVACIGVGCDKPRRWTDDEKALLENAVARAWPLYERALIEGALRESEEALQIANDQLGDRAAHLENIVQQRTGKLSETIAELEAFSYSISHDMRAPLRSMISFADILLEDYTETLDETAVDYLTRISSASRRMDRLIQDVLNFSRIGRKDIVFEPTNVEELLNEIIRSYPNFHSNRVTITIAAPVPLVMGNEALLTQCFSNLLENAVKFGKPGEKAIIGISAAPSPEQAGYIRISIRDNGIGIPAHSLERIFEIFQRVGREGDGTGIGLAIVRKAVEKMGGRVGVESEPDKGSLFWLDLESV